MKRRQIINIIGLVIGFASLYLDVLTPFWGIVFLFCVYKGNQENRMMLFYDVYKKDSPILYWLLLILWVLIGFYFLLYHLINK